MLVQLVCGNHRLRTQPLPLQQGYPSDKVKAGKALPGLQRTSLILILLVALITRLYPVLSHWSSPNVFMQDDSWSYHLIARNLLEGNGYSWEEEEPYETNVYRPPGMPIVLLGIYSLFGVSIPFAILLQVAIGTLTVFLTYVVATRLCSGKIGFAAGALQALDPLSISYSNLLLTEVYSSAVMITAIYLFTRFFEASDRKFLFLMSVLFGFGIMIHPILLFLPIIIAAVPFLRSETRTLKGISFASLFALFALAPAGFWIARNAGVADYTGISCVTAVNLMKYKAAGVMAEIHGTDLLDEAKKLRDECEAVLPRGATRGERWRAWERKAKSIILAHPFVYAKIHLQGAIREFFGPGRDDFTRVVYGMDVLGTTGLVTDQSIESGRKKNGSFVRDLVRYIALLLQGFVFILFFIGCAGLLFFRKFWPLLLLSFPICYVLLLSGGPEAFCRFRVIYMPFVSIIAAIGLTMIFPNLISKDLKRRLVISPRSGY